ncbi:MAG: OmpA family protein [Acidobacteria bacterium]|nr:OmpA family protein [Acidobacteriota bacterium]
MRLDKLLLSGLALLSFLWWFGSEPVIVGQEQTNSPVLRTESLQTKVLDLVFRIEDLGGKVQDLQVKETGQEVRIELAADVLFEFDKADILPKAQAALKQAAGIIRDRAKGAVRIEGHTDSKGSDTPEESPRRDHF